MQFMSEIAACRLYQVVSYFTTKWTKQYGRNCRHVQICRIVYFTNLTILSHEVRTMAQKSLLSHALLYHSTKYIIKHSSGPLRLCILIH